MGCRAKQTALLFLKKAEWSRHNKGCIPAGSIGTNRQHKFVRQDDAGLHLPGHCDITGP